jgi:LmbE family N-acetylglucosaminyl deacetylase
MSDRLIALAMGAHPDDIEFMMAGRCFCWDARARRSTSAIWPTGATARGLLQGGGRSRTNRGGSGSGQPRRRGVSPSAVRRHRSSLRRAFAAKVSAVVREVDPDIVLTLSRYDYMEDHEYASRLTSSAVFNRLPCPAT